MKDAEAFLLDFFVAKSRDVLDAKNARIIKKEVIVLFIQFIFIILFLKISFTEYERLEGFYSRLS